MEDSMSKMGDYVAEDAPDNVSAYPNGKGDVSATLVTSLSMSNRTMPPDSQLEKVKKTKFHNCSARGFCCTQSRFM